MKKPTRAIVVEAWWPSFGRWVNAKWTGRRWMRFNELFGGYDPVEAPEQWREKE